MDLITIFTGLVVPIVAILAFGLSVYNTYNQWKRNRPNISLNLFDSTNDFGGFPDNCYILSVKNLGNVNVIIDIVGFKWDDGIYERSYYRIKGTDNYQFLPYKIEPGSTLFVEFYKSEIKDEILKRGISGLIKASGFIKDGNKKYFISSPIEVDVK
jgi:hypothetical protein